MNDAPLETPRKAFHPIGTDGECSLRHKACRVSSSVRDMVEKEEESMLVKRKIEPSDCRLSFLVILMTVNGGSLRFCVNYGHLNKITMKDIYPLPRIGEQLNSLRSVTLFVFLELCSDYLRFRYLIKTMI